LACAPPQISKKKFEGKNDVKSTQTHFKEEKKINVKYETKELISKQKISTCVKLQNLLLKSFD
jgi:hypothetical protein